MSADVYYHLHAIGLDACTMTEEGGQEALSTWLCSGCDYPKPGVASVDVHIEQRRPRYGPITFVYGFGVAVVSKVLLASLGEVVIFSSLYIGKVYGPDGGMLDDWVTCRGKHLITLRGSRHAQHRWCDNCGRLLYFAMGVPYLCPGPPEGACVWESHLNGLVVPSGTFERAFPVPPRRLGVAKLKVVGVPRDGFGDLGTRE